MLLVVTTSNRSKGTDSPTKMSSSCVCQHCSCAEHSTVTQVSLHELGLVSGTDKAGFHGFLRFYDRLLMSKRHSATNMLEIGINTGASLLMWRDYFTQATIYGLDINVCSHMHGENRIVTAVADQNQPMKLAGTVQDWNVQFDFIIDDGGHTVIQQYNTIYVLWSLLKPGGVYVIEDLHTNIRALHFIHEHMSGHDGGYIDASPTVHERILNVMSGSPGQFPFIDEVAEINYFCNPTTKSLTCAFIKKM